MKIKIDKLHTNAVTPRYATDGSGAFDLVAVSRDIKNHTAKYGTGIAIEVPKGHTLLIFSRSGHGFNSGLRLANCTGIIDSDYRGEIMVKLKYDGDEYPDWPRVGDRIAQGIIIKTPKVEFELGQLSTTERGQGGFGSSGK